MHCHQAALGGKSMIEIARFRLGDVWHRFARLAVGDSLQHAKLSIG